MSDVKARLAAVRTEYAPHGWSDTTLGGFEIVFACDDEFGGVAGIVKNHGMHAVTWDGDGVIEDDDADDCSNWNLVPLPAPVAVQDEHGPADEMPVPQRIAEQEAKSFGQTIIDSLEEFNDSLNRHPVQKLATSGFAMVRPVPAVDAWVTYGEHPSYGRYRVDCVETVNGETRIISGSLSIQAQYRLTGPSDRGPWRPIGEVR